MKKTFLPALLLATFPLLMISCKNSANSENENTEEAEGFASPRTVISNPSPAHLSPEESLKTFRLPKGYHLELVANEPMIKEPVAVTWDGDGKMYVAQMETYMQDVNATGEQDSISRIMLLE